MKQLQKIKNDRGSSSSYLSQGPQIDSNRKQILKRELSRILSGSSRQSSRPVSKMDPVEQEVAKIHQIKTTVKDYQDSLVTGIRKNSQTPKENILNSPGFMRKSNKSQNQLGGKAGRQDSRNDSFAFLMKPQEAYMGNSFAGNSDHLQTWINKTDRGFHKFEHLKKLPNRYHSVDPKKKLEEQIYKSLEIRVGERRLNPLSIEILKKCCRVVFHARPMDNLNQIEIQKIEDTIFKEFVRNYNQTSDVFYQDGGSSFYNSKDNSAFAFKSTQKNFRTTSLSVPGFAHDGTSDYTQILKNYNKEQTQQYLKKQMQIKQQNEKNQRDMEKQIGNLYNQKIASEKTKYEQMEQQRYKNKIDINKTNFITQKEEREALILNSKEKEKQENQFFHSQYERGLSMDMAQQRNRSQQNKQVQSFLVQQMKNKEQQKQMEGVNEKNQDLKFLQNVGFNGRTNQILHQKSIITKKRQIKDITEKVIEDQAWENPVSDGTIYNQFYCPNPEQTPMKPFPKNLDNQLQVLEKSWNDKHKMRAKIQEQHIKQKMDEQERKIQAEMSRRKEVLKQAQLENLKQQKEKLEKKQQERKQEKQIEDKKALEAKEQYLKKCQDEQNLQRQKAVQNAEELKKQMEMERQNRFNQKQEFIQL